MELCLADKRNNIILKILVLSFLQLNQVIRLLLLPILTKRSFMRVGIANPLKSKIPTRNSRPPDDSNEGRLDIMAINYTCS